MRPRVVELLDLAFLSLQVGEIDRASIDARRSSGFEPGNSESCLFQLFGKMSSCVFTRAAAGKVGFSANMDSPAEESAGSDNDRPCTKASSFEGFDAKYTCFVLVKQKPRDGPLHGTQGFMFLEEGPHCASIEPPVALSAWSPYRWTLAPIEHAELEHSEIRGSSHYPAQSVHFAYDGSFRNPTDRRVARHLADRFERASDEPYTGTQASCRNCGFSSGVTGPDDNHIELGLEILRLGHTLKISIATNTRRS